MPQTTSAACAKCGASPLSTLTDIQVCEPCRLELVRHPFPRWVKVCSILVLLVAAFSIVQIPHRWTNAVHLQQARNLLSDHKWPEAYELFQPFQGEALQAEDVDLSLEYAESAMMAGHSDEAALIMTRLSGHQATNEQIRRADNLGQALANKARAAARPEHTNGLPAR